MDLNRVISESQDNIQILDQIDNFFDKFRIGTHLDQCGIRKRHGYSVRSLIKAILALPFIGKNFFRGIVINEHADVGKDAAYGLFKAFSYNWRRFLLIIGPRLYKIFGQLISDRRESVLIIDGSPYDRSRSKKVELSSLWGPPPSDAAPSSDAKRQPQKPPHSWLPWSSVFWRLVSKHGKYSWTAGLPYRQLFVLWENTWM